MGDDYEIVFEHEVFPLEPDETVGCYYCMEDNDNTDYKHGEAFLAGPDHPPWDGNANYICMEHLSDDAVIVHEGGRRERH